MTKAEFVGQVAERAGLRKKDAEVILECLFATAGKVIQEEGRFAWPGFGTFTIRERTARKGRNPRTGATIKIKASRTVGFKPAPSLRQNL
ncbi:MAG: HU family DNA-binding protein [Candidatus Tectomicrobia bacterium]|nr:HU family DNA-binding protein [Candidatus Tectomicrobia bacterium]